MTPRFPIYIISKGRYESRLTVKALEAIGVPYTIVVEDEEYLKYAAVIDKKNIVVLDKKYQEDYDAFEEIGVTESKGSGPARNFVWDHSVARGFARHWVLDDNIKMFCRYNKNLKVPVSDGTIFRCMEDFVLRYTNVAMAGPHYFMFASRKRGDIKPFTLNTRVYSCNLIKNDVGLRWRGRYNEDVDLSLRMLKAGWCIVLFNAFLQYKMTTQSVKGGNEEIYSKGTLPKTVMLAHMHPDVVKITKVWNRWHHYVDYRPFKRNKLIRDLSVEVKEGIDNYGMERIRIDGEASP